MQEMNKAVNCENFESRWSGILKEEYNSFQLS